MKSSEPLQTTPNRRPGVVAILAALLLLGLVYAIKLIGSAQEVGATNGAAADGVPPAAVYVQKITEETTQDIAKVTGSLRATAKADVAASEAGLAIELLVDEGDAVTKDAPMAKLDDRRITALLGEAKAAVTAAKSLVKQRNAEAAR